MQRVTCSFSYPGWQVAELQCLVVCVSDDGSWGLYGNSPIRTNEVGNEAYCLEGAATVIKHVAVQVTLLIVYTTSTLRNNSSTIVI